LEYDGAALKSAATLKLRFDVQGSVITASADGAAASAEEIAAIRSRAQLLRSHALAQQATRTHQLL
jgi:hypothetical protein